MENFSDKVDMQSFDRVSAELDALSDGVTLDVQWSKFKY